VNRSFLPQEKMQYGLFFSLSPPLRRRPFRECPSSDPHQENVSASFLLFSREPRRPISFPYRQTMHDGLFSCQIPFRGYEDLVLPMPFILDFWILVDCTSRVELLASFSLPRQPEYMLPPFFSRDPWISFSSGVLLIPLCPSLLGKNLYKSNVDPCG